ncbi:MAG: hypothetical protein HKN19_03575 [Halioglobus sp.]|nr:hypothetical protein [Halioglobus sp.]
MDKRWMLSAAVFFAVVGLIAVLAWVTDSEEDPCANPDADVSAAVLGESEGDQEGLVNRAIIVRGNCKPEEDSE